MTILLILGIIALLVIGFLATYKVVGTNEAHVIVFMGRGRWIKTPVKNENGKASTSYFFIPFLMKRYVMPLTNVKFNVNDIPLNDKEVAPFICDVVTWLHIEDPDKASERLDFSKGAFESLNADLTPIVQAIARTSAMKQEILEIMRDRETFAKAVSEEVDQVLQEWGVKLVNLEINDIRDDDGSNIIADYETMRKAKINSQARIEIATRDKEAIVVEQENKRESEVATAEAEKVSGQKRIEKDTVLGIADQEKLQKIAEAKEITNTKEVNALRVSEVGKADILREAEIVTAEGKGEAIRIQGEKEANVITLKGDAEGNAIKAKGLAEAEAKDKMAEALKKYNESATIIEKIKATVEVQKAFAEAYGKMAENAEIKVVSSGEGADLFGIPLNAKTGADFGQLLEGLDLDKVKSLIPTKKEKTEE